MFREVLLQPDLLDQRQLRREPVGVLLGVLEEVFESARIARATAELAAATNRAEQEVRLAAAQLEAAAEAARAFDIDVVSGADENLALSARAYEAGKIGLADLLLVRRSAVDARRDHIEALAELASAEAQLARAAGSEHLVSRGKR